MAASTTPGRPATCRPMPSTSSAIHTASSSTSRPTAGTAPGADRCEKGKKGSGGRESFYDLRGAENSLRQSEGVLRTVAGNASEYSAAGNKIASSPQHNAESSSFASFNYIKVLGKRFFHCCRKH